MTLRLPLFRGYVGAAALAVLVLLPASVAAWGVQGHQVAAALAEDMLTAKAKAQVHALLDPAGAPGTLASVASWADDVRTLRPNTRPWHYITLENDNPHPDPARADTPNVVTGLQRQLAILSRRDADRYAREEALKWVVHLVGDLHQPLHAGEDHDKGGNLAQVRVNRRAYALHAVWDYVLLEKIHLPSDSITAMLEREITAEPGWLDRNAQGTPAEWVKATHALAPACYLLHGKPLPKAAKVQLDRDYVHAATLTSLAQLKLAGAHLAFVLNQALDSGGFGTFLQPHPGGRPAEDAWFAQADAGVESDSADAPAGNKPSPSHSSAAAPSAPETTSVHERSATHARDIAMPPRGNGADTAHVPIWASGSRRTLIAYKRYSWSTNSKVYHLSICADVRRILRKNLQTSDKRPEDRTLHDGCPIP